MGTSSRPRKNPFKGQGLVPGLTLHLEFTLGERQEALVTQVEQVDESELTVLVPIQRLQKRLSWMMLDGMTPLHHFPTWTC